MAETKTFELTNNTYNAVSQFTIDNLLNDFTAASVIQYEEKPNGSLQKRLIEDVQTIYLNNDLKTPLPLSQLDTLGFTYQTFKLAFTPSLVTNLYGTRVTNQMLIDAKYVQQDGVNWWVPFRKKYLFARQQKQLLMHKNDFIYRWLCMILLILKQNYLMMIIIW